MMKRFLSIMTCLILVLTVVNPTPLRIQAETAADVSIGTAAELVAFANASKENTYAGKTIVLTDDIDLSSVENFPMIGQANSASAFQGTFDGQGHTIKNLTIVGTSQYQAFIRSASGSVIRNLVLENPNVSTGASSFYDLRAAILVANCHTGGVTIQNVKIKNGVMTSEGGGRVGGLVGASMGALTIDNCEVDVTLTAEKFGKGGDTTNQNVAGVGGVVGTFANSGAVTISNTTVSGTINGRDRVGGIVGSNVRPAGITIDHCVSSAEVNAKGIFVGGIAGYLANSTVKNSSASGNVNSLLASGSNYAGGIVGLTEKGGTILNCAYSGRLTNAAGSGPHRSGGIVGSASNGGTLSVTQCEFSGVVTGGGNMIGGIVGNLYSKSFVDDGNLVGGATTWSNPTVTITDCFVMGQVQFGGMSGNICGYVNNGSLTIANCAAIRGNAGTTVNPYTAATSNNQGAITNYMPVWNQNREAVLGIGNDTGLGEFSFSVTNAYQLTELARMSKVSNLAKNTLVLANDIDLNPGWDAAEAETKKPDNEWPMFGYSGLWFRGTIDGGKHAIKGVYVDSNDANGVGFIGTLLSGTVKNLRIENSYLKSGADTNGFGSVVGTANGGCTISNVYSNANLVASNLNNGGIVGRAIESGTTVISNCAYAGSLTGITEARNFGGILGASIHNSTKVEIRDCLVSGEVSINAMRSVGGVLGNEMNASTVSITRTLVVGKVASTGGGQTGALVGNANDNATALDQTYFLNSSCTASTNGVGKGDNVVNNAVSLTAEQLSGVTARAAAPGLFDETGDPNWTSYAGHYPTLAWLTEEAEIVPVKVDDISAYRTGTMTVPAAPAGMNVIFAGWYSDEALTTPISEETTSGAAYAKFVDADVLKIRYQLEVGEGKKMRIVTTVDSLDLANVGFKLTYTNADNEVKELDLNTTTVYSELTGWVNASNVRYTPDGLTDGGERLFSEESAYFLCFKVTANDAVIDAINASENGISVTPYWTTKDGTAVTGTARSGLKFQ